MKYIIDLPDTCQWVQWINQSIDDGHAYCGFKSPEDLTPLDKELDEAYRKGLSRGYKDGYEEGRNDTNTLEYQRGLEEGKVRNEDSCVGCRYDDGTTEHSPCNYCCNAYSNQWSAKPCSDEIKVGDEVKYRTDDCGVVTGIYGKHAYVLWRDGSASNYASDELIKTGRHFNFLASLLNAMKEGAE